MLETLIQSFNPEKHIYLWLSGSFMLAFIIAYLSFPTILYVAREKHLVDEPESRSQHNYTVPTLGGVGIFFSLIVVMTITGTMLNTQVLMLVMGATTILFFLGLKDDLTILSAKKKFMGQLIAALLLIIFTDTRIIGFSNILDIDILPYWISVAFTLFVYILIINAFNLIDGIDGLAGSVALTASAIFTILFVIDGEYSLATISIALVGALVPFLKLNFSSRNKMFMGDTGAMIIGFLLAYFTINFISNAQSDVTSLYHKNAPAIALAILFYPLMDTLRIFAIRLFILRKNPFLADNNHIHHRFLKLGINHFTITFLISLINIVIVFIAFNCFDMHLNNQIMLLLLYGSSLFLLPFIIKVIFTKLSTTSKVRSKSQS